MAFESANHSVKAKTSVIKTRLHNNKTLGAQLKLDATNEIEWTTKEKFPEIESATVYFGAGST